MAIVLCGVCRDAVGPWAVVAYAVRRRGAVADRAAGGGLIPGRSACGRGTSLSASADRLRVDLGPDARLELRIEGKREWGGVFGGIGPAQVVPGLPQYWHPWLLGGRVVGSGWDGAVVYAEKNWGPRFTEHWWWGQAQGFAGATPASRSPAGACWGARRLRWSCGWTTAYSGSRRLWRASSRRSARRAGASARAGRAGRSSSRARPRGRRRSCRCRWWPNGAWRSGRSSTWRGRLRVRAAARAAGGVAGRVFAGGAGAVAVSAGERQRRLGREAGSNRRGGQAVWVCPLRARPACRTGRLLAVERSNRPASRSGTP